MDAQELITAMEAKGYGTSSVVRHRTQPCTARSFATWPGAMKADSLKPNAAALRCEVRPCVELNGFACTVLLIPCLGFSLH